MRRSRRLTLTISALGVLALAPGALGVVHPGDVAPNFTKNELDAPPPAARTLSQYAGKVVVLFLLGYN
jgi:hypothetical protein